MSEKVNNYHSLINLCVFYLPCHLAQRRAESLQFMILSRNIRFISWVRSQIRYSSTSSSSMTGGMCQNGWENACLRKFFVILSHIHEYTIKKHDF